MNFIEDIWVFKVIIRPALDVLLLSFLLYNGYKILAQTRAVQLVKGALFIAAFYGAAYLLKLSTVLWILNLLVPGIVIGIAIVFQPELRKIFTQIGKGSLFRGKNYMHFSHIDSVINSAEILAGHKRGALIVFRRTVGLKNIIESGTQLNANLSSALVLSIFHYDTPLHDGAIIIHGDTILAAGCFLPLSGQVDIRRSFGTRHRAALGLAEESDAVILVVSEETGAISLACEGNFFYDLSTDELRKQLVILMNVKESEVNEEKEEENSLNV